MKERNKKAPKGKIYRCAACGKVSKWSYGYTTPHDYCSYDFDVSCVMNSYLAKWDEKNNKVIEEGDQNEIG